jgi:hypothetical protein
MYFSRIYFQNLQFIAPTFDASAAAYVNGSQPRIPPMAARFARRLRRMVPEMAKWTITKNEHKIPTSPVTGP